ncbi:MAG TPA: hypothetical protein PLE78_01650 [Flavobacteriales bacterium]|nr:hypothetical protein [Flavobacteriales bacterium]
MVKDRTIHELLKHLTDKFGVDSFIVRDHWDADLCAIGIENVNGKYLLYLNSYGRPRHHFYLDLENVSDPDQSVVLESQERVSLETIDEFFELYILRSP